MSCKTPCRLCNSSTNLEPIFKKLSENPLFLQKISDCTNIQISESNEFDINSAICFDCVFKIIYFNEFKNQCLQNDVAYQESFVKTAENMKIENNILIDEVCADVETESQNESPVFPVNDKALQNEDANILPENNLNVKFENLNNDNETATNTKETIPSEKYKILLIEAEEKEELIHESKTEPIVYGIPSSFTSKNSLSEAPKPALKTIARNEPTDTVEFVNVKSEPYNNYESETKNNFPEKSYFNHVQETLFVDSIPNRVGSPPAKKRRGRKKKETVDHDTELMDESTTEHIDYYPEGSIFNNERGSSLSDSILMRDHSGFEPTIETPPLQLPRKKSEPRVFDKDKITQNGRKCPFCKIYVVFNMNRHLLKHSNYRPYNCNICGKGFKTAQNRDRHVTAKNVHRSNLELKFECHCGAKFFDKRDFRKHVKLSNH